MTKVQDLKAKVSKLREELALEANTSSQYEAALHKELADLRQIGDQEAPL